MNEKIQEIENKISLKMKSAVESLKTEFGSIHAGRVSSSIIEKIKVNYYGNPTPITQLANISTPEPQMLAISPWEKNMIKEIERSLLKANLGFSVSNDGNLIRAIMPPFTEERRKELVKHIKKKGEESKISVRNVRREGNENLKNYERDKIISKDEEKNAQSKIQDFTDVHINSIDNLIILKEKELMSL